MRLLLCLGCKGLGYRVIVPERKSLPAIRPLLHFGMLDTAARSIRTVLQYLHPFLAEGIPIVGLEPITVVLAGGVFATIALFASA
jgi:hypothetical protein